ncbi:MAG: lysylphosphatidylglycerol synthase domain-containing protein, partial [Acidimicrobiales bacterium]
SVVLERLTGWIVLPVITFAGLALNPGLRHLGRATQLAVGLAAATLVLPVLVMVAGASRRYGRIDDERGWRRFLAAVAVGLDHLRRNPMQAFNVIMVAFAYQLVLVFAAVMAAQAIGIKAAGPTALLAFFPAVAIAQVLPVSISGLGVREGLFVLFLRPLGVPPDQAVALGLLLYALNLLVSLLGAPSFAIGGRRRQAVA